MTVYLWLLIGVVVYFLLLAWVFRDRPLTDMDRELSRIDEELDRQARAQEREARSRVYGRSW